jgi:hypothetical protein
MLQKKYEDYLKEIYTLFPDVKENSIKHIIEFGLKKIYDYVKTGSDILMTEKSSYTFIGRATKESAEQWGRSMLREHTKLRRMFMDKKESWDGFHYFGLTEEENSDFQENPQVVTLYKIKKECSIRKSIKHIYRINLKYALPDNKVSWREEREVSLGDCEVVLNLKYKKTYEEN